MQETEGVIKYNINYVKSPAFDFIELKELDAWRTVLFQLNLIGQDPKRYDGFSYGNLSRRLLPDEKSVIKGEYIISGTQTGHLPKLDKSHYALVTQCNPDQNSLVATGPVKPSSESLTHGAIYQADTNIQFVFHVHSPEIWKHATQLNIHQTHEHVQYGTPGMALELKRLISDLTATDDHIVSMQAHQDGVICYGTTAEEAGSTLIKYYCRALQC